MECIFDYNEIEYKTCDGMCKKTSCKDHIDHIFDDKMETGHYGYYDSKGKWVCYLSCQMCEIEMYEEQIRDNNQEFEKNK